MKPASGPDWFAIIGAAGGVFAIVWTLWRAYRERERLHLSFYAFDQDHPDYRGLVARVDVVNLGSLPAHIIGAQRVKKLPYSLRWPLRLMSFRTRDRWPIRVALERSRAVFSGIPRFESQVVPPRQLLAHRVDRRDTEVERWVRERQWLVVSTAIRWYVARISDNRPPMPPDYDAAP